MRTRLMIMLAVGGVVVAGTGTLGPAKAQASPTSGVRPYCIGTRIESHQIRNAHYQVVGRTELWFSPINGGENCVMTYNRAGSHWTGADISRLRHKGGPSDEGADDSGYYHYYAGGAYVDHTNGRCVTWGGVVGRWGWFSSRSGVHCR